MVGALTPGTVVWADFGDGVGKEQSGRRPAVVVSSLDHLAITLGLAVVLPGTTVDRGWPNHVELEGPTGLAKTTYAMTEQPRTIDVARVQKIVGVIDIACLEALARWTEDWTIQSAV